MLRFTQSMHTYTAIMFLNVKLAVVAVSVDMQYCVGCATVIVFVYNTLTNSMGLRVQQCIVTDHCCCFSLYVAYCAGCIDSYGSILVFIVVHIFFFSFSPSIMFFYVFSLSCRSIHFCLFSLFSLLRISCEPSIQACVSPSKPSTQF